MNVARNASLISVFCRRSISCTGIRCQQDLPTSQRSPAAQHCLELVRDRDRENFLIGMLLPREARAGYFSVRAMNVELATIQEAVGGNASTGQLRIGWWREAITQLYDAGFVETFPQHPVVTALGDTIRRHSLPKVHFDNYLDARERDLCHDSSLGFASLKQMELYALHTAGAQLRLALGCVRSDEASRNATTAGSTTQGAGVDGPAGVDAAGEAADLIGVASGLCTLLRGAAHHARVGQCYLPRCSLERHGLTEKTVGVIASTCAGGGEHARALRAVCGDVLDAVEDHLERAQQLQASVPRSARGVLLSATCVQHFVDQIRASDCNLFDPTLVQRLPVSLVLKMWWRATTARFM